MHIHKQWPGRPDAGARARTPLPQRQSDRSDVGQAPPEATGCIGAPKSTPRCLSQPGDTTQLPLHPQNLSTHFKSLNRAPFGLVFPHRHLQLIGQHPQAVLLCLEHVSDVSDVSQPQQSDACWSWTGWSEIGVQQMEQFSMTHF